MNSFEINKIITAIIITVLIVVVINKVSDLVFDIKDKNIVAYKVEAPEGSVVQAKSEIAVDLSSLFLNNESANYWSYWPYRFSNN